MGVVSPPSVVAFRRLVGLTASRAGASRSAIERSLWADIFIQLPSNTASNTAASYAVVYRS